jgi:hypothetical protein
LRGNRRERELERLIRVSELLLQRPRDRRVQRLQARLLAGGRLRGGRAVDSGRVRLVLGLLALPPRLLRLTLNALRGRWFVAERDRRLRVLSAQDRLNHLRLRLWWRCAVVRDRVCLRRDVTEDGGDGLGLHVTLLALDNIFWRYTALGQIDVTWA